MFTLADNHRAAFCRALANIARAVASVSTFARRMRRASARRRDVEMLESLPAAVLRDVGVRRELVPLVVDQATCDASAREAQAVGDSAGGPPGESTEVATA